MDPDANLQEQERILTENTHIPRMSADDIHRLRELRGDLFAWIVGGGFPPDWDKAPNAALYFKGRMQNATHLQNEHVAYPHGGLKRKGRAILRRNEHNPVELPYGEVRAVWAGIPDTYWTIPAVIKMKGRRIKGYIEVRDDVYYFTPNADPARCQQCAPGDGCKKKT